MVRNCSCQFAIDGRVLKKEEYRRVGKIRSDKEWYIKKFIMYLGKYIVNTKRYLAIQQLSLIAWSTKIAGFYE